MKKTISLILTIIAVAAFALMALASGSSEKETKDQGTDAAGVETKGEDNTEIGKYILEIQSCRLAKSFDDKDVVIVKYLFTNVSDDNPAAFNIAFSDEVYQNGVGLNPAYILDDSANYSYDNQSKKIQKGASIEVEAAYELNDITTDITVEVERFLAFDNTKITKTFKIA